MTSPSPPARPHGPRRLAAFIALATALAIPLRVSGVAMEQAALGLALAGALALMIYDPRARQRLRRTLISPLGGAVAAIVVAWAAGVGFSFDPLSSAKMGGRTIGFIVAAIALWAAVSVRPDCHRLLWKTLVVAAVLSSALALAAMTGVPLIAALLKGHTAPPDSPALMFKAFATSVMCLIPVAVWAGRRLGGMWRWWGYAFAVMALGVMTLTYSRSALAGLIAMTIVCVILLALAKRRHAKALLTTTVIATSSVVTWVATREANDLEALKQELDALKQELDTPIEVATYMPTWLIDAHRQNIWKFAYEHFLNHPWVGNGIDQLNRLPGAKMSVPGLDASATFIPSHPHNWALEILAETGLIGFMPVLIVLIVMAVKLTRAYLQNDDEADIALLALMAGFWGSAFFNFSIWAAWWQLTFLVLFAIVAATRAPLTRASDGATPPA